MCVGVGVWVCMSVNNTLCVCCGVCCEACVCACDSVFACTLPLFIYLQ